jgi:hypothetical protein
MRKNFLRRYGATKPLHRASHCGLNLHPAGSGANVNVALATESGDNAHRR